VGQKVHPVGFRVGVNREWSSRWYADKQNFGDFLVEDYNIRDRIKKNLSYAGISRVEIERAGDEVRVLLHTARPGIVIGRKGVEVERLGDDLARLTGKKVTINIHEVKRPELDAQLVAEAIAEQLEKRASYRRAVKKAMETTMQMGAKGIKVSIAGRVGGSEMTRRTKYVEGSLPLQTLDAEIDYGFTEAKTNYGHIGIQVWINRGLRREGSESDAVNA
jgi:small subunit ribosomal protein S3